MITNKSGIIIRMNVSDLRIMGRATQGVRAIRLDEDDEIADVTVVAIQDNEEDLDDGQTVENKEEAGTDQSADQENGPDTDQDPES